MSCLIKVEGGVGNRRTKYIFLIINCNITLFIYIYIYVCIYNFFFFWHVGSYYFFPSQGWHLRPLQWKPGVLNTVSPRKSLPLSFYPAIISFHFRVYSGLNCAVKRHLFLLGRIPPKGIKFWISGLKTSRPWGVVGILAPVLWNYFPGQNFTSSFFCDGRWKKKSYSQQRRGLLAGSPGSISLPPVALLVMAHKTGDTASLLSA